MAQAEQGSCGQCIAEAYMAVQLQSFWDAQLSSGLVCAGSSSASLQLCLT